MAVPHLYPTFYIVLMGYYNDIWKGWDSGAMVGIGRNMTNPRKGWGEINGFLGPYLEVDLPSTGILEKYMTLLR